MAHRQAFQNSRHRVAESPQICSYAQPARPGYHCDKLQLTALLLPIHGRSFSCLLLWQHPFNCLLPLSSTPCPADVQQLVIQHTDNSSSSSSRPSSSQPGWLWLQPTNAWASKLQDLQLHGVPLLLGPAALTLQVWGHECCHLSYPACVSTCEQPSPTHEKPM